MKTLAVLRHAKSSWKQPELSDHDRPLNKRGRRDGPRVGRFVRDNGLFWDDHLTPGMALKVRPVPPKPTYITHRVARGETLGSLARRYGTSVRAIQAANTMGRGTLIRVGQSLRIPTRNTG